ncbi:MAG: AbrB/MazE/SpoVT family DNA-binding domain-containing protein [Anaerolineales bacterium]|jgi:antitoxin component of MazEF toxin-antitoxin module
MTILRKVFKTGNSLVVSLPRDLIEPLGMTEGTEVSVELDRKNRQILIRSTEKSFAADLSEEFACQVSDFIIEYKSALEALAHK